MQNQQARGELGCLDCVDMHEHLSLCLSRLAYNITLLFHRVSAHPAYVLGLCVLLCQLRPLHQEAVRSANQ